jgi:hypothetical protein
MDALKRHRYDPSVYAVPNCRIKCEQSLETTFNFIKPAAKMMDRIASIVEKVDASIDQLRDWERSQDKDG